MVDIHCHIIFGVDDGSSSISESVKMARIAAECGVSDIIATPHGNVPDSYGNYWNDEIKCKFEELKNTILDFEIPVSLYPGQEIFCTSRAVNLLKSGSLITLNNTDYVLTELSFDESPISAFEKAEALISEGYRPIIAHPERYGFIMKDIEAARILKNMGCLLQLNKGSITGKFGRAIQSTAFSLLKNHIPDIVASDAHGHLFRTTDLKDAYSIVSDIISKNYSETIFNINPKAVLNGQTIN